MTVNRCPKCNREIYADPDYCVMCGWERGKESTPLVTGHRITQSRAPDPRQNTLSTPPMMDQSDQGYSYIPGSQNCPQCGAGLFTDPNSCALCGWAGSQRGQGVRANTSQSQPSSRYRSAPPSSASPIGGVAYQSPPSSYPSPEIEDPYKYRSPGSSEEGGGKFVCANCENPNLQFTSDGMSRCPTCERKFRFRPREEIRGKHSKQFICSKCDNKNLQFFFDGKGLCPQCKHTFKWKRTMG